MQLKRAAIYTLTLLVTTTLLLSNIVYAWNPSTNDLKGTESSSNSDVAGNNLRFDIYTDTGICGVQVGEDDDSIAFLIKLAPESASGKCFRVDQMRPGDQYEVRFIIGPRNFSMLFKALEVRKGTCSLYYSTTGGASWSLGESFTAEIKSETLYNSSSGNTGFILKDATVKLWGYVKFIVKKDYLFSLGARGSLVTGIFAIALAGGNGQPGEGVDKPNDRCPESGTATWTLKGDIPDLPMGILLLAFPIIAIYAYLKRSKGGVAHGLKIRS